MCVCAFVYTHLYHLYSSNLLGYQLADDNTFCSVVGLEFVDDVEVCRNKVGLVKTWYPDIETAVTVQNDARFPDGCYVNTDKFYYGIYFNRNKTGKQHWASRQLCIRSGKLSEAGNPNYSTWP